MRRMITAAALAATALAGMATPALAQSRAQQSRWEAAQARYRAETDLYYAERNLYFRNSRGDREGYGDRPPLPPPGPGYGDRAPPPPPGGAYDDRGRGGTYADDRDEGDYDPAQHYRPGTQERVLAPNDRVYADDNGRYYCKRSDGTTGLIVGAASGGLLGNVIDGGHSRTAGTLLGAAIGALAGKAVDQKNAEIRCR